MDKDVLKSAVKGMELLAKQNGVTILVTVHDPETDWCNDLICGKDDKDVINSIGNLICTAYDFVDKSNAGDLDDVLEFVKENREVFSAIRRAMKKFEEVKND